MRKFKLDDEEGYGGVTFNRTIEFEGFDYSRIIDCVSPKNSLSVTNGFGLISFHFNGNLFSLTHEQFSELHKNIDKFGYIQFTNSYD